MSLANSLANIRLFLEAEINHSVQDSFEIRYLAATGVVITPGSPAEYQDQPNKWGSELRIYFNDQAVVDELRENGLHVENRASGYLSDEFSYRVSNNELWWYLVEAEGKRLGYN